MNTFNRKTLYAALAGLGAIGATGAAEAVNLNPDGLGQVLIYPYYTVRSNASGFAYNSLLSVVNTTASAKAVKVRILEGKNSKEVLDFNLFLSKFDVWTASIVATADGAKIQTTDTSCTLPAIPAAGQPFVNYAYSSDGADASLDRTREGYVEIIEMATFANGTTTQVNITHVGGVPPGCSKQTDAQANSDADPGNGGLFGAVTLINVLEGSAYSQDATAIDNFNKVNAIYFNAGLPAPTLANAFPRTSVVVANGNAVVTNWSTSIDAVSATLMHNAVLNEYSTEPTILANTDWIITMPTKNQYVSVGTGSALPPFQRNFNGNAGACDDVQLSTWDREERSPSTPGGFSPPPPAGKASSLCWEANVINFLTNGVLGSTNNKQAGNIGTQNQINGWAALTFLNTAARLIGGATTTVTLVGGVSTATSASSTYSGLPVVGFAVQAYNNNLIVAAGKNIQSTYGADFGHRFNTTIVTP